MTDRDDTPKPDLDRVREALREAGERPDERSHRETERDREARERLEEPDERDRRGAQD